MKAERSYLVYLNAAASSNICTLFFFNDTATTNIYTLSLHDALPIALGDLDRVDLADEVGDRDVGRRQLLAVAAVARDPDDLGRGVLLGEPRAAGAADRREGVVVDLAAGERGHRRVEQGREEARHACLGLAALAEENDVLAREDRVLDLRHDALLVAHDPGEERLPAPEARDQVVAQLLLDRLRLPAAGPELADRARAHLASPFSPSTPENHAERSSTSASHTECAIGYSRHVTR